jgi:hypothetical protein
VLEVHDVAQIRAAPFVDRLVGIADDAKVAVHAGQERDEQVLRAVRVLVLVDHHVLELAAVALPHGRALVEELDGLEQQIVEVERVGFLELRDVSPEELADLPILGVPATGERVGPLHPVLGVADARQHSPWLIRLIVEPQLFDRLFDDGLLIGRVVDDEVAG